MRSESAFAVTWALVEDTASDLVLEPYSLPRPRKVPRRLEHTDIPSTDHLHSDVERNYRKLFFEFLDTVINGIKVTLAWTDRDSEMWDSTYFLSYILQVLEQLENALPTKNAAAILDI